MHEAPIGQPSPVAAGKRRARACMIKFHEPKGDDLTGARMARSRQLHDRLRDAYINVVGKAQSMR